MSETTKNNLNKSKLNTNNLVTVITSLLFLIPNISQYN